MSSNRMNTGSPMKRWIISLSVFIAAVAIGFASGTNQQVSAQAAPPTTAPPVVVNPPVVKKQLTYVVPKQQLDSPIFRSLAYVSYISDFSNTVVTCLAPIVERNSDHRKFILEDNCANSALRPGDSVVALVSVERQTFDSIGTPNLERIDRLTDRALIGASGVYGRAVCDSRIPSILMAPPGPLLFSSRVWLADGKLRVTHSEAVGSGIVHPPGNLGNGAVYSGYSDDVSRIRLQGIVDTLDGDLDTMNGAISTSLDTFSMICVEDLFIERATEEPSFSVADLGAFNVWYVDQSGVTRNVTRDAQIKTESVPNGQTCYNINLSAKYAGLTAPVVQVLYTNGQSCV